MLTTNRKFSKLAFRSPPHSCFRAQEGASPTRTLSRRVAMKLGYSRGR